MNFFQRALVSTFLPFEIFRKCLLRGKSGDYQSSTQIETQMAKCSLDVCATFSYTSHSPTTFRIIFKFHKCHRLSHREQRVKRWIANYCTTVEKLTSLFMSCCAQFSVFLIFQHQSFEYPKILPEITRQERRKALDKQSPRAERKGFSV